MFLKDLNFKRISKLHFFSHLRLQDLEMSLKYSRLTGASVSCRVKRRDCTKWSPGLSSSRLWLFLPSGSQVSPGRKKLSKGKGGPCEILSWCIWDTHSSGGVQSIILKF